MRSALGRDGLNGAGRVPAVAAIMSSAFDHAQYVWLAGVYKGDTLYVCKDRADPGAFRRAVSALRSPA
jgi:hypothetical protein